MKILSKWKMIQKHLISHILNFRNAYTYYPYTLPRNIGLLQGYMSLGVRGHVHPWSNDIFTLSVKHAPPPFSPPPRSTLEACTHFWYFTPSCLSYEFSYLWIRAIIWQGEHEGGQRLIHCIYAQFHWISLN